jgi:hypothetical protein
MRLSTLIFRVVGGIIGRIAPNAPACPQQAFFGKLFIYARFP